MNERLDDIPVIIPSLEPDERLMDLIKDLKKENIQNIILINDGSSEEYNHYFEMAQKDYGCTVLRHYVNLGKGRALKNAFNYCLLTFPNLIGCVTADSDGQHRPKDIKKCMEALHATNLILGCRDFNKEDVPQKSRLGNKITRQVCKYLCGIDVSDTQTGLRAIPKKFMKELLSVSGERFEFETNMLIETKKSGVNIEEVEIQTVYDSKDNHTTHFNPIKDSIMIYKIFGRMFIEFIFSSLSSSVIDLILFAYFCKIYSNTVIFGGGVALATISARIISAIYNYIINYKVVFKSSEKHYRTSTGYFILALIQMCLSAVLVTIGVQVFKRLSEIIIKIVVDIGLFILSFWIQREWIFKEKST